MRPLIFSLYQHPMADLLAQSLQCEIGELTQRHFPDQETYLRITSNVNNREVIVVDSLDRPDLKFLPLLFFARTAKDFGAKHVNLCAPYLSYMRQDKQFHPGEAVTSHYFSALLSSHFDALLTVDPHLHRIHDLNEIYSIPTKVIHASRQISQWIINNVQNPLLIGPDLESVQWIAAIADQIGAPYLVAEKTRHTDRAVAIALPSIDHYPDHTPVLIDDIISTAQTMLETIKQLKKANKQKPICIAVHGIFVDRAFDELIAAQIDQIVTCNTVPHSSNHIDLSAPMGQALSALLEA